MKMRQLILVGAIASLAACGGGDSNGFGPGDGGNNVGTNDTIEVKMTVASLPAELPINRVTTDAGALEYGWSVTFDLNENYVIDEGDMQMLLGHFKAGDTPTSVSPSQFQASLNRVNAAGIYVFVDTIHTSISGNTISLYVSKNVHDSLKLISQSTGVHFRATSVNAAGFSYSDYYPGKDSYADMSSNGQFTDPPNDIIQAHADLLSMSVSLAAANPDS